MSSRSAWSNVALVSIGLGVGVLFGCGAEAESAPSQGVAGDVFGFEEEGSQESTTTTTGEPAPSPCGEFTVATTFFDSGSASLSSDASDELLEVLDSQLAITCVGVGQLMCPSEDILADVVGHTDSRPNPLPGGNQLLSEQRAEAVADLLAQRDINSNVSGVANQQPVSETDHEQNRRVQVSITCDTK